MSTPPGRRYASFTPEALQFLRELEANNNREWFAANKLRYEAQVLDAALRFIQSMQEPMSEIAPHFTAIAKRTGGSLMRVYRDTRFSKNKTPYKTNVGIQFRHEQAKDVHAPGYYLHIEAQQVFLAVGMWRPESAPLQSIRRRISEKPAEWQHIGANSNFKRVFRLGGESLRRPPRGFDKNDAMIEDIKRKDFIAVSDMDAAAPLAPRFQQKVETVYKAAEPLMRFLCKAINIPF